MSNISWATGIIFIRMYEKGRKLTCDGTALFFPRAAATTAMYTETIG